MYIHINIYNTFKHKTQKHFNIIHHLQNIFDLLFVLNNIPE